MKLPKTPDWEVYREEYAVAVDDSIFGYYTSEKGRKRVLARARRTYPDADIRCVTRGVRRDHWVTNRDGDEN